MCHLIDYPDGSTVSTVSDLLARYPSTTGEAFVDGLGLTPLATAPPNDCLCNTTVEEILDEAGEVWIQTDTGYEVRPTDKGRYPASEEDA